MIRCLAGLLALVTSSQTLAADRPIPRADREGFYPLFNGTDLSDWTPVDHPESFQIKEGAIVANGAMTHLFYTGPIKDGKFKDFELRLDFRTEPNSNGGVFFHTEPKSGTLSKGYEVQVNHSHSDVRKSGGLFDIVDVTAAPAKDHEWATLTITVKGKRIITQVNGQVIVDYLEPAHVHRVDRRKERVLGEGQIALQAHDPVSVVWYRNIRIKPLD